ncbi:MAG TPA: orotate phosphoribosyltransferase [Rhizomicrobium sp.]
MTPVAGPQADPDRKGNEELRDLIKQRSFRRGKFTLSSGRQSDLYFNLKSTMMTPRGALLCARAFLSRIEALGADFVGGLEMGAVPILGSVAALSEMEGKPVRTFFVRKTTKAHGTRELVEGLAPAESLAGARILVVDDVASTGGSVLEAVKAVRAAGGVVDTALVIIDRQMGAAESLRGAGIGLLSIFLENDFR